MKKLFKNAVLAIGSLMFGVSVINAQTFEYNNVLYTITSEQEMTVEVASGRYSGDVDIPSQVSDGTNNYTVTGIGMGAFAENGSLTGISLPQTLTSIGNSAFYACLNLKEVIIPENVRYIGVQAFISCIGIEKFDIPASVETIGSDAFQGCSSLKAINVDINNMNYSSVDGVLFNKDQSVIIKYPAANGSSYEIPSTVNAIETNAFFGAGNLTSVLVPEGVETINSFAFCGTGLRTIVLPSSLKGKLGANAFRDCQYLSDVEIAPNSVELIGESAFYYNTSLQNITIPEGVTGVEAHAFEISSIKEISLPSSLKILGASVFSQCYDLSEINLPENVETIGDQVFYGCSSLRAILLPNNLITIGSRAFEGCTGLSTINIPSATTTIGSRAFDNCSNLTSITVDEANTFFSAVDGILYDKAHTSILVCPIGITGDIEIPEGVTNLGEAVFSGCYNLTGITIPKTVTSIDFMAFYGCSGLQTVFIPSQVESIGNSVFANCYSLNTIICAIEEPVPLQEYTFYGVGTWAVNLYVPEGSVEAYKETPIWNSLIVQAAEEGMIPSESDKEDTQLVSTFDFSSMDPDKTPTSNNGHDGDITKDIVITEGFVTLTISPNPDGSEMMNNFNRFYLNQNKIQLRMYGGTLSFSVPDDVFMKQIEIFKGQWNANNNVDGVPLKGENQTTAPRYWNGLAQEVVINIINNSQINTINVTLEDKSTGIDKVISIELDHFDGLTYDLSGKVVSPDTKGIVIRRAVMQDGTVKMMKILNK